MGSASATGLLAYCHRSRQSCLFLYSVCHLASKSFLLNLDASIHAVMTNTHFIQNSKGKRDRMKGSHNWGLRSTHPKSHHWCSEYTNLERVYCKIQGSPPFVRQTDSNLEPPWNILRNLTVFWGRAGEQRTISLGPADQTLAYSGARAIFFWRAILDFFCKVNIYCVRETPFPM